LDDPIDGGDDPAGLYGMWHPANKGKYNRFKKAIFM